MNKVVCYDSRQLTESWRRYMQHKHNLLSTFFGFSAWTCLSTWLSPLFFVVEFGDEHILKPVLSFVWLTCNHNQKLDVDSRAVQLALHEYN